MQLSSITIIGKPRRLPTRRHSVEVTVTFSLSHCCAAPGWAEMSEGASIASLASAVFSWKTSAVGSGKERRLCQQLFVSISYISTAVEKHMFPCKLAKLVKISRTFRFSFTWKPDFYPLLAQHAPYNKLFIRKMLRLNSSTYISVFLEGCKPRLQCCPGCSFSALCRGLIKSFGLCRPGACIFVDLRSMVRKTHKHCPQSNHSLR